MPLSIAELDIKATIPDIPPTMPVVTMPAPCLKDRARAVEGLTKALRFEPQATADVPHGYLVGGRSGQVEVFTASGAIRARNTAQLNKFQDERRNWADLDKVDTPTGVEFTLGRRPAAALTESSFELLDQLGLASEPATKTVSLGQWALLDDKGNQLDAGPGRATVSFGYAVEGLPLIGAGAKTNFHYDPDDADGGGVLARFFHVHRGTEATTDVATSSLEQIFAPLFAQTWSGVVVDPKRAHMTITSVQLGLLALPADVSQRFAAPALAVEGRLQATSADGRREIDINFGQYLPVVDRKTLSFAGFISSGPATPGSLVKGSRQAA